MIDDFAASFVLGLLTPLTAACVLPLYPGFISYLTQQTGKANPLKIGFIVSLGVVSFMLLLGLIFTSFLQVSLTSVIGIISPIAFAVLGLISIFLILGYDLPFPQISAPVTDNPTLSAFLFGFFFGAVVVPCNPLFIAALFTKSLLTTGFLVNVINFLFFGLGIGFPLLLFAALSGAASKSIISFLSSKQRIINLLSGIIMLAVSIYYLIFVFKVIGSES